MGCCSLREKKHLKVPSSVLSREILIITGIFEGLSSPYSHPCATSLSDLLLCRKQVQRTVLPFLVVGVRLVEPDDSDGRINCRNRLWDAFFRACTPTLAPSPRGESGTSEKRRLMAVDKDPSQALPLSPMLI